jgi:hypothetical protein
MDLVAVITVRQVIELVILFIVINVVVLLPLVVAVIAAFGERVQNQAHRPRT